MTTQFINPTTSTTIKVEIAQPDWFRKFLEDNSHMSDRVEEYSIPKPEVLTAIPMAEKRELSCIERLSFDGEFDPVTPERATRREHLRKREMAEWRVRGHRRESIDTNKRNAKRQRADIIRSRGRRHFAAIAA